MKQDTIPGTEAGHSYKVAFEQDGVTIAYRKIAGNRWVVRVVGLPEVHPMYRMMYYKGDHASRSTDNLPFMLAMVQAGLTGVYEGEVDLDFTGEEETPAED